MNQFYITLPSNTINSGNLTSQFRVRLAKEIRLDGNWEVALVEFSYPNSWDNITTEIENGMQANEIKIHSEKKTTSVFLEPGNYNKVKSLVNECVKKTRSHDLTFGLIKDGRDKVRIILGTDKLTLSPRLAYVLGFGDQHIVQNTTGEFPADMRAGMDALFVYCDVADMSLVGDSAHPLLRSVPASGNYLDLVHHEFRHLHYVPLLYKQFSSIGITINTDTNRPVPFKFGKSIVKLHFRRI